MKNKEFGFWYLLISKKETKELIKKRNPNATRKQIKKKFKEVYGKNLYRC